MYFEDFDMGLRANATGWRCYYESKAVATHFRGGSDGKKGSKIFLFRKKSLELKRHLLANRYLVLAKNAPAGLIIRNLPFIIPLSCMIVPVIGWLFALFLGFVLISLEVIILFKLDSGHRLGDVMADTSVVSSDYIKIKSSAGDASWLSPKKEMG